MDLDILKNIIQNSFNQAVEYCNAFELENIEFEQRFRHANRSRI